jgi:hypothetical protein
VTTVTISQQILHFSMEMEMLKVTYGHTFSYIRVFFSDRMLV